MTHVLCARAFYPRRRNDEFQHDERNRRGRPMGKTPHKSTSESRTFLSSREGLIPCHLLDAHLLLAVGQ